MEVEKYLTELKESVEDFARNIIPEIKKINAAIAITEQKEKSKQFYKKVCRYGRKKRK